MKKIKLLLFIITIICFLNIFNSVNAVEELPDNGAKISSSQIIQTKTGTGPFDENDEPGNDSSEDNNIVRSFDQVTWTVENTMVLNSSDTTGYTGGRIYFEATLPDTFTSETIKWDLDSMGWIENAKVSSDGLTLTGYYSMSNEEITIPGKQTLIFVTKVLGAKNGLELQPNITLWLNGNQNEDYYNIIPEKVYVSAAPKYNVKLVRNSNCATRTTVNIDGEDITGRMYGYALVYQLYNENIGKGLKGIEYPSGEINLDLEMIFQKQDSNSGEITDITDEVTPILWNYQVADTGTKGLISGRNMFTGTSSFAYYTHSIAPGGKATSQRISYVLNSGNIDIEQNGNILSTTLTNYEFDGTFPIHNYGYNTDTSIAYTDNVGCFASIFLQILVPDWDDYSSTTDYYFKVNDINFKATSITGDVVNEQAVKNDDTTSVQYSKYVAGSYSSLVYIYKRNGSSNSSVLHTQWNYGDGRAVKGQELFLRAQMEQSTNNDEDKFPRSINCLYKFDGDCYQPVVLSNGNKFTTDAKSMTFKMWYVTKKDGTNWNSQQEMNKATVEDCNLYENLNDIPDDKLCVGVYYESQSGIFNLRNIYMQVPVVIKDTAVVGQTYGITQKVQYYTYELDRNIYTAINENVEWPDDYVYYPDRNYVKTEYDENGTQISGTHAGGTYYGNTVQVIGATQSIQIWPVNKDTDETKINYDFSKNEYKTTFKISPSITNTVNPNIDIKDIAVSITAILPNGLSYVPNSSSYGEPQITINEDGTTLLEWTVTGCEVNKDIEDIYFDTHIDEESSNGKQYDVEAQIYADPQKVGTQKIQERISETAIQVINLSSHRLYKTVDTPVIEKDGEVHFTISYKNNTDVIVPSFQLLDILPYNGDGRGTAYVGDYTLDRLEVTQTNKNGEKISNDNLEILYTTDESVRGNINSTDEDLAEGWTEVLNENINQKATAFAIKGKIESQGGLIVDIYLKTNGNVGLNKYVNNATAKVIDGTEEMRTSNVISQVVKRKIEGVAWEDLNANGLLDSEEKLFENVEVTLVDDQGRQVTDVNGQVISSVRTDENGYYSFNNLPKGDYYVRVLLPDNKYEITDKLIGMNSQINSKFNVEKKETDEITRLNSIDLPELTESNVNVGFVKKETKVVVNYKEIGTNNKLYDEVTINGRIDDEYSTENKLDEINANNDNKYEYVRVEGTTTGTMTEDTIYVTYWYQKKVANVKVLHVLEGTDVSNPENVTDVLYPTEEITGRVDDNYTTQNRLQEINENSQIEYELVTDNVLNKTGQMTVDTIYVVYEYRTIPATIKIEHKDIDTDEELMDTVTEDGMVGEEYTTTNKLDEINTKYENKYELVSEPENKDGKYKREEQTITYYYQKKIGEVEVNYLEVGTEKVLASQEILKDKVDKEYITENKLDEINANNDNKYEFVKTTGDPTEGIYKLEKQVINYYYQKKAANVKVLHVLEGTDVSNPENVTDVLYPTEELTGRVDDNYTTQNRLEEINGNSKVQYDLVTDEVEGKTGQMIIDTIYVVYEYRKAPAKIKIEHKDVDTNEELMETVTEDGIVGEEYTTTNKLDEINAIYENKYELVSEPENKEGEYKREEQIITYYYRKKPANVIVKYVDVDTEEELIEGEEIVGRVDDEYKTIDKIKEINENSKNKYVLVKTTENTEGKMELETIEVIYYYKKVEAQVIVIHKDEETGEEIADRDYIGGYVGDEYITSEKEIDGYELVIERIPLNKEGEMEEEVIEVIYYYKKIPKVENIDTGDIAVYTLIVVAVISILGITYVVVKNKKNK